MDQIPQEIIDKYNLKENIHSDGYCYAEIRKIMYGLREAGYITNVKLKKILGLEGYVPSKFTPGLFTHNTRDIELSLVVDDFGVKYTNKNDADHLITTLQKKISNKNELGRRLLPRNDARVELPPHPQ